MPNRDITTIQVTKKLHTKLKIITAYLGKDYDAFINELVDGWIKKTGFRFSRKLGEENANDNS